MVIFFYGVSTSKVTLITTSTQKMGHGSSKAETNQVISKQDRNITLCRESWSDGTPLSCPDNYIVSSVCKGGDDQSCSHEGRKYAFCVQCQKLPDDIAAHTGTLRHNTDDKNGAVTWCDSRRNEVVSGICASGGGRDCFKNGHSGAKSQTVLECREIHGSSTDISRLHRTGGKGIWKHDKGPWEHGSMSVVNTSLGEVHGTNGGTIARCADKFGMQALCLSGTNSSDCSTTNPGLPVFSKNNYATAQCNELEDHGTFCTNVARGMFTNAYIVEDAHKCLSECTAPADGVVPQWCDNFMAAHCKKSPTNMEDPACACLNTNAITAAHREKVERIKKHGESEGDAEIIADTAFSLKAPNCWYPKCAAPSAFHPSEMRKNLHSCNTCVSSQTIHLSGKNVSLTDVMQKNVDSCSEHGQNIVLQQLQEEKASKASERNLQFEKVRTDAARNLETFKASEEASTHHIRKLNVEKMRLNHTNSKQRNQITVSQSDLRMSQEAALREKKAAERLNEELGTAKDDLNETRKNLDSTHRSLNETKKVLDDTNAYTRAAVTALHKTGHVATVQQRLIQEGDRTLSNAKSMIDEMGRRYTESEKQHGIDISNAIEGGNQRCDAATHDAVNRAKREGAYLLANNQRDAMEHTRRQTRDEAYRLLGTQKRQEKLLLDEALRLSKLQSEKEDEQKQSASVIQRLAMDVDHTRNAHTKCKARTHELVKAQRELAHDVAQRRHDLVDNKEWSDGVIHRLVDVERDLAHSVAVKQRALAVMARDIRLN